MTVLNVSIVFAEQTGTELFRKGQYDQAAVVFGGALKADSESPMENYNLGTALYKQGQYEKSVEHLQKALLSDDEDIRQKAQYNLGSAYYQIGKDIAKDDLSRAKGILKKSLEQFAVVADNDPDAMDNYLKVKKIIDLLEQMEKQQQQSSEQEQKPSDQKQEQEKQDKKESSQSEQKSTDPKFCPNPQAGQGGQSQPKDAGSSKDNQDSSANGQKPKEQTSEEQKDRQDESDGTGEKESEDLKQEGSEKPDSDQDSRKEEKVAGQEDADADEKASGEKQQERQDMSVQDEQSQERDGSDAAMKQDLSQRQQMQGDEKSPLNLSDVEEMDSAHEGLEGDQLMGDTTPLRYEQVNEIQAKRLLEQYQETEEPKGLLNFYRPSGNQIRGQKDW